jgi:ketosteroid isomerase-like protein
MAEENAAIVRLMLEAFLARDVPTALSFYSEDVEWDGSNLPDGPVGRGHQVILDHVARWAEAWDGWSVEIERVVEASEDQVILLVREKGKSESGLLMDEVHAELYTLKDGKIIRRQGFSDPSDAFEAVGETD